MANDFVKEETVYFDNLVEGFEENCVLSSTVDTFNVGAQTQERSSDTVWRPMPYIATSFDGVDQTDNFQNFTELSVPSTVGYEKSVPWIMSPTELRDLSQSGRIKMSAEQKLASDVNTAVNNVAALQGTIVVKRTAAASGFDDVAQVDTKLANLGVTNTGTRYLGLPTNEYNSMANNLQARETMNEIPTQAFRNAYIGNVSNMELLKLDTFRRQAAAAGSSITVDTQASAGNYHVPKAKTVAAGGESSNYDNRYQTIAVSSTTNVAAGDSFTIAGVAEVHHITKQETGDLKTFRVISVDSGSTMTISPAIVSNQGGSNAEAQYQNCVVTPSATADIVFLNTVAANACPFWTANSIEIMPSSYEVETGAGLAVLRATTKQGLVVIMTRQGNINNLNCKYRVDVRFGVTMLNPEMAGVMYFSQS